MVVIAKNTPRLRLTMDAFLFMLALIQSFVTNLELTKENPSLYLALSWMFLAASR